MQPPGRAESKQLSRAKEPAKGGPKAPSQPAHGSRTGFACSIRGAAPGDEVWRDGYAGGCQEEEGKRLPFTIAASRPPLGRTALATSVLPLARGQAGSEP